ncbi:hypothetical protein [Pseudomonas phage SaPL]|nr:hypothetical protein [Pseudomonas phage SaPL]QDH46151.1 hypothetical protein Pa222_058 [Pseudomonas virus Pa222]
MGELLRGLDVSFKQSLMNILTDNRGTYRHYRGYDQGTDDAAQVIS